MIGAQDSPFESALDVIWPYIAVIGALILFAAIIRGPLVLLGFFKVFLFCAAAGLVLYFFMGAASEREDWKNWADAHCKIVEKRDGRSTTGVGVGLGGKVGVFSGSEASQTAYDCDDGVIYWKNY